MAKRKAGGGDSGSAGGGADMANMEDMLKNAMNNPELLKNMGDLGNEFGDALQQMMQMSPDELAAQM